VTRETVFFYDQENDEEWCDMPLAVEELGRGLRPGT
jgi:hypothetical protein